MPLTGEGGKQTSQGGDHTCVGQLVIRDNIGLFVISTSHHRQQPAGLLLAHRDDGRGQQQGDRGGGGHQPAGAGQGLPPGEVCEVVEEEDGQGDLEAVGDDVD